MSDAKTAVSKTVCKLENLKTEVEARAARLIEVGSGVGAPELLVRPEAPDVELPFLHAASVQMISYFAALAKGTDVDQPKNLAKSVTVE